MALALAKPQDVFGRGAEWSDLADFAVSPLPGLRIAVVYGRRRQGKSYLLRRLAEACGGLYHLATEQAEAVSVRRFADAVAEWQQLPAGALGFRDWEHALDSTFEFMTRRGVGDGFPPLLVLDEFPYLANETQGLASVIQGLYDRLGPGGLGQSEPLRLILCGSAISVMSGLLSGTKALRGRGALELKVKPFGYREARRFWQIEDLPTAFLHNALIGGTPGYRDLAPVPHVGESPDEVADWIARNVLRPSVPLFDEANRVVHEDPRIRDAALYSSILAVVAAGESSPTKIGGLLQRPATSLTHQLTMLESAGFLDRSQDLLLERRPVIAVNDPVIRLHHLVIEPYQADLEAGRARRVWTESAHTVESKILGPHFETLAAEWVRRHAAEEAGLDVGVTGQTIVPCREHKTGHEIDILSLARGARPRTTAAPIAFIGEAKSRDRRPGTAQLERLEHVRALFTASGHDASKAQLGLFSTSGFTDEARAAAAQSAGGILLVGLDEVYGESQAA
jgi:hypothetical protein